MPVAKRVIVSCGIFREELEYLIREGRIGGELVFLDAALHVNFDKLKEALLRALDRGRQTGSELKVLYGACHPRMDEILAPYGATRMSAGNCLEALVGEEELRRLDAEEKTFFLSAGWINNWERMFALGREDFSFDFRAMLRTYRRAVVFETGVVPVNEDELQKFQQFTQLPVERRPISLEPLLHLLRSL